MKLETKLMKQFTVALLLCAVAGGVLLSGCSKSKTAQNASSGNGGGSAAATDDSALMKVKWATGKKYSMRMELTQTTKTAVPNMPQPVSQEMNMAQDFSIAAVKDLDNGGQELELEFMDATLDLSQGDRKLLSFDSTQSPDQDSNNPVAPILRAMTGSRLQYYTDANGKVEKVEGVDELLNKANPDKKSPMAAQFGQLLDPETIKQYGSFGDMMPNRVVKIGETWSNKRDITTAVGIMAINTKYTFKNWEQHDNRKCARISADGEISAKGPSPTPNSVQIEDGKISGDVWFDPESGITVDSNIDVDMTLKITTRGMTLSPKVNERYRISLVNVADAN